ncbi:MAG TPA: hypothetical protein VFI25_18990 [Planctomycetota bacterium]|nr:hypothetical protein [Planctomycetota bacterium]
MRPRFTEWAEVGQDLAALRFEQGDAQGASARVFRRPVGGGVFTRDVLETWIETKRKREVDAVRLRPHPYEFFLYYDA